MGNAHKHIVPFCCVGSMLKKSWVDNILANLSVAKRNHLYQQMCQLMYCIIETTFNAMCEDLIVEYEDKPSVWQYRRMVWHDLCVEESMAQVW